MEPAQSIPVHKQGNGDENSGLDHLLFLPPGTICRTQCKIKMWVPCQRLSRVSKWLQQSIAASTEPF